MVWSFTYPTEWENKTIVDISKDVKQTARESANGNSHFIQNFVSAYKWS